MQKLLAYIHTLTDLSERSWEVLSATLITMEFKKGEDLLKEGRVCHNLFFIEEGFCRSFYEKDGIEKNTAFYFENDIATNISSFAHGGRSAYYIQACEPLKAVVFDKEKLLGAYKEAPELEMVGRKCLQVIAAKQQQHADLFKLMTTREQYEYLETQFPHILQRVSLSQLSSYLGVSRETLSRIRNRRAR